MENIGSRFPAADLVHVHDARGHSVAALFARTPVVVARRVAFAIKSSWLSRWKYRRAAHYIAVSQFVAGLLIEAGIPQDKISVIHDGVPLLPLSSRGGPVIAPQSDDPRKGSALLKDTGVKFSSNLEADLLTARILVYLTHAEGLGSGALLGMSAGVPVIASSIGGLPEAIARRSERSAGRELGRRLPRRASSGWMPIPPKPRGWETMHGAP